MEKKLTAAVRQGTGKGVARQLRADGKVPAVLYGHDLAPVHLAVDALELFHVLHTDAGMNVLVDLHVDGDRYLAMPREVQRDAVRRDFLHADFIQIKRDEKIHVDVPIHPVGESRGVKEGGLVEHHLWELKMECFPQDVPEAIEADITELAIGDQLRVEHLAVPDAVTVLTPAEEVVLSVVPPPVMKLEEEVPEEEAAEAVEGEAAAEAPEGEAAESGAASETESGEPSEG